MINRLLSSSFLFITYFISHAPCSGEDLLVEQKIPVDNGYLVVIHTPESTSRDLMIHFHGAVDVMKETYKRSESQGTLVVVNFPGLSAAYSKPFTEDSKLFDLILSHARKTQPVPSSPEPEPNLERITLSSFSAGFGAVREILKSPENFDRIDALIMADSIYAGLKQEQPERLVEPAHMQNFLKFAILAAAGKKAFVLSHSAQETPYASTTETANYLLNRLQLNRQHDASLSREPLIESSRAGQGGFLVLGYEGTSGPEHMQHLQNIDLFWKQTTELLERQR